MRVESTAIPDVKLVIPTKFEDHRGFFVETWNRKTWAEHGVADEFVQDNHSLSRQAGTVRGLHFQSPPFAQAKLIRVVRGSILDVAVDIRRGSPTFRQHVAVRLTAGDPTQMLVPVGFAHGFCTLEPDTEVVYKVTGFYSRANDHGILWNDPSLDIAWPVAADAAQLSDKDRAAPKLAEVPSYFTYAGTAVEALS